MNITKKGVLESKCKSCHCEFEFTTDDAFHRYEVCGGFYNGVFEREYVAYVRCPTCKKRVIVTKFVSEAATAGHDDPLCKCNDPWGYCKCDS